MTGTTSQQPEQELPFIRALPWVMLVSSMFLLTYLDRAMFGPLLPNLEEEFSISHAESTSFLFYMSLGYSVSVLLSGFSAAKIRPRIMVGVSMLLCGFVMLALASTTNLALLTVLFVALGVAAGQYFNGGLSTMRSLVRPSQWSKAISVHEMGPNGSFIIGPLLAIVAGELGWRDIVSFMGWLTLAGGVVFMLIARGGHAPAAPVSFKGIGGALKKPNLWLFTWLMGLAIAGEFAPYSVLTLHMIDDRSMPPDTAAFLLSTSRIAAPFAVLGGGFITARFGTRRPLVYCLIGYAAGMFLMSMPWVPALVAGMFIQPALTAMVFPPVFTMLAEAFPAQEQPLVLSLGMPMASFLGAGLMPSLLGLWGEHLNFNAGFIMMGCLVALSLPLLKAMPAPVPR